MLNILKIIAIGYMITNIVIMLMSIFFMIRARGHYRKDWRWYRSVIGAAGYMLIFGFPVVCGWIVSPANESSR